MYNNQTFSNLFTMKPKSTFTWTDALVETLLQCRDQANIMRQHNETVPLIDLIYSQWELINGKTKLTKGALKTKLSKLKNKSTVHEKAITKHIPKVILTS